MTQPLGEADLVTIASDLAVEAADHHRATLEVRPTGTRRVLLGRPDVGLQAGVAQLHDVAGARLVPGLPSQVPVDDVPATGAQAELHGGGVADDPVPDGHRARELGEHVGPSRFGVAASTPRTCTSSGLKPRRTGAVATTGAVTAGTSNLQPCTSTAPGATM